MKRQPPAGLTHRMDYVVPTTKTVPHVFDDSEAFTAMPQVFATAFLVGLFERACLDAIMPYLDWPAEQTVGTHIDVSHVAATPPDMTVTVDVELTTIDRRRLVFDVTAHDGIDEISRGRHERFVIDAATFTARVAEKAARSDDTAT